MSRSAALALAGVLTLASCGGDATADPTGSIGSLAEPTGSIGAPAGDTLPDVDLTGLTSGETSSLAAIDGPAVVNLWATWCAPCRAEIPDFEDVHQARGDEIRFLGINIGEDPSDAQRFIEDVGATYDQFADLDGDVATALRATAMPVTVVIDADGVITTRHLGPLDENGLNEAIDEALGISSN